MVVAFVLGSLMALAAVLLREMSDRKVRTVDDVVVELKQKLLVVMPSSARRDPVVGTVRARILGRLPGPAR
jgi:capsular polysaccharide biosynthesis protein